MKFYFIKVRHDVNGHYLGFDGWKDGYNGPHGEREARRLMAFVGGEMIPVEIDDPDELLRKAKDKVEESAVELANKRPTPSYHDMTKEMTDAGFDWVTEGDGRKLANVKKAYEKFHALQEN